MPRAKQKRFANAVMHMMTSMKDPRSGSSEYFRLASYHGWPSDYCSHRQEAFPRKRKRQAGGGAAGGQDERA